MSGEGKYFVTPMEDGLRIAGTVELAGLDAPPNYARADPLLAGLTAAAPTSEVVADLVDGREPFLDIRPFAADRSAIRRATPVRLAAASRTA